MSAAGLPTAAHTLLAALFPDEVMTEPLRINLRGQIYGAPQETAVSAFAPSVPALHTAGYADTLRAWNQDQGRSVYVAPGLRRGRDGTKNGVVGILAFWADLDVKAFVRVDGLLSPGQRAEGKRVARARLRERLPVTLQPSILIDTGGGLQCWWLFKEAAWLGGDDYTVETLEGYLKGLATALDGDPAVTHLAACMRLPGFANRKYPDGPIATIVTADLTRRFNPSDFADYWIDIPEAKPRTDDVPSMQLGPLAPVLATCGFLQWCRDHPADVHEPLWYAMCSNLVRLEGGREAAHAFSRGHPGYSAAETDAKLDHALAASGPISCAKIQELGFPGCPVDGHGVRSPAGLAWKRPTDAPRGAEADAPAPPVGARMPEGARDRTLTALVPYESLAAVLDRWVADDTGPPVVRIATPSPSLNRLLGGGLTPGELLYLGARPGVGKTALALECVRHAGGLGHGGLVISREMATLALACRMLAQVVRVGVTPISTHRLAPGEAVLVQGGLRQLAGLPVWLTEAALTLADITRLVETFPQPLALLVVDYLQLIAAPRHIKERRLQVEHISAALKDLAKRRGLATLCLSSLTRYGDGRDDARPTMAHLRESGELEHDADVVLLLHRQPNAAETDLIIAKARNAQTGVVRLLFRAEYTAFDEAASRAPGEA